MSLVFANMFRRRFQKMIRQRGSTLAKRQKLQIRNVFTYYGQIEKDVKCQTSGQIIANFLLKRDLLFILTFKITKFAKNISWLIEGCERGFVLRKKQINIFKEDIWKNERMKIWEAMAGKLSQPMEELKAKIVATSQENQEKIQDLYIRRQRLHGDMIFMDWFIKTQQKKKLE